MVNGPPCQRCGWILRWLAEQNGWGCDRCRMVFPASPAVAAAAARTSNKLPIALIAGAAVIGVVVTLVLVLKGGGGGGVGSRDELVSQAITAIAAGDVDGLTRLADVEALIDRAIDCSGHDDEDMDGARQARKLRGRFERAAEKTKGMTIEVVEIEQAPGRGKVIGEGGKAGKGCVAKIEVAFQRVKAKVKVKQGDRPARDGHAEISAIEAGGRWYLSDPPEIQAGVACEAAVARALKDSHKELAKLPGFAEAMMPRLEQAALRRCKADAWSEEAMECMADEDRVSEIEFCIKKLASAHQDKLTSELVQVLSAGKAAAAPPPPIRPDPVDDPPEVEAPPPTAAGDLAANGLPACEDYRALIQKYQACTALPQASRDLYKKMLVSLGTSWRGVTGTTGASMKKTMNDVCRRGVTAMKQAMSAMCP